MFTDWHEALEVDGLPLHPTSTEQEAAAARTCARHALVQRLGLPELAPSTSGPRRTQTAF